MKTSISSKYNWDTTDLENSLQPILINSSGNDLRKKKRRKEKERSKKKNKKIYLGD